MMGKASSKKRALHHDSASGRFEPAGPMNDLAIRNYAKTTLAALEHLIAVYQVLIDDGDFQEVRVASLVSFQMSALAQNIKHQLTLRQLSAGDEAQALAQIARRYPCIFTVDGMEITAVRRVDHAPL